MVLRKLAVALLSAGVMLPGLAHALAVLDTKTKSALGEPYRAEIELSDVGDLSPEEIRATLATAEDFQRLGVERDISLTELKFNVVVNKAGRSYISVYGTKPVREPYLNYVVRLDWPGNVRLQEVTSLLDPPLSADARAAVVTPIVRPVEPESVVRYVEPAPVAAKPATPAPAPAPVAQKEPAKPAEKAKAPAPKAEPKKAPAPAPAPSAAADSYAVNNGDTLWAVALKVRPSADVSVHQTMIALQRENPNAFVKGNINQLKRGAVLSVPSADQIQQISAQQAKASVQEQIARTAKQAQPVLAAQQLDATAVAPAAKPAAQAKPEMKLLAAEKGTAASGTGTGSAKTAQSADASKKVKEISSESKALKQENKVLADKVGTLDSQVKANDKKLEVQNAKLAELQKNLKEQEAKKGEVAAAPAKADAVKADAAKVDAKAPAADGVKPVVADAASANEVAPGIEAKPLPEGETAAVAADAKADVKADAEKAKVAKADVKEPAAEASAIPSWAPAAGGLAALLLGGFLFFKKRREKAEEEAAMAELDALEAEQAANGGVALNLSNDLDFKDDDLALGALGLADEGSSDKPLVQDAVLADPLDEVEQYLAYERYPQAAGFLSKAVAAAPERTDLRVKLLEVYARLDDHNGFAEQQAALEDSGDLDVLSRIEELKGTMSPVPVVAEKSDMIEFDLDKPEAANASANTAQADDDVLSLDDLEMDFSTSNQKVDDTLEFNLDTELTDADFDFTPKSSDATAADDLSFASFDAVEDAPAAEKADDLSFDLSDEFADVAPAAVKEDVSLDTEFSADADLSFSLDEDLTADFTPSASAEVAKADDELSFTLDDLEFNAAPASVQVDGLDGDFAISESAENTELSFDTDSFNAESSLNNVAAEFDVDLAPQTAAEPAVDFAAAPAESSDLGMDDDFDFLADTDENATKLDLARAYIDMGDKEGARDILQEVLSEGSGVQQDEAKELLEQVS